MYRWGYENPSITYSQKVGIAYAAASRVLYDHGYSRSIKYQAVILWGKNTTTKIDTGVNDPDLRVGSISYVNEIEYQNPRYLHVIYYYSIKTYGAKSGFQQLLSASMNQKNDTPRKHRPIINMSRQQLNNWFIANKGKEYSPKEKPLNTPQHKLLRLKWVRKYHNKTTNSFIPVAYLG